MQGNSILFISYWYPYKGNENSAIFVKRHAQTINTTNSLTVLTLNIIYSRALFKKNIIVFNDEKNVKTHQIYLLSRFNKLVYLLLPLHYIILKNYIKKELIQQNKITIIHSNVLFPSGIMGYWLSKKFNCKHIITEHWSKIDKFFKTSLYKLSGKKALNNAYAITCVSEALRKTLQKHTSNKQIFIVPNLIDSSQFYYDKSIKKNEQFTFIAVAHWSTPKNPFYFLNALQTLTNNKKISSFKMVIVGGGKQIDEMKKANYSFNIEYKGSLNSEEIRVQLNKSHIFLHGSDYETFSVIIAEALLCGLPSVVSPHGIALEVINATNGFVTTNTKEDWENKILACYQTSYNSQQISEQLKGMYDIKKIGNLFNLIYSN